MLKAKGKGPADSSPLWFVTGDHAYEVEVEIDADEGATAGLLLFYNRRLYIGLGYSAKNFIMHSYGIERPGAKPPHVAQPAAPPPAQRPPHRDDRTTASTARRGSGTTAAWRCRGITTTSVTTF